MPNPFDPYTPQSTRSILDVPAERSSSCSSAPRFTKHREIVGAVDAGAITNRKLGMNMSDFEDAIIRVVPSNGADPDIEVLFWSEEAGKFIADATGLTATGVGANVSYDYTCARCYNQQ